MPDDPDLPDGPTFKRLKDQIDYYSTKSRSSQRAFKRIKVAEIVAVVFADTTLVATVKVAVVAFAGTMTLAGT